MHLSASLRFPPQSASVATALNRRAVREDDLEGEQEQAARKLEEPRWPGETTREQRQAAMLTLMSDGLKPAQASDLVESLCAASAGVGHNYQGGGLFSEPFLQQSVPPKRPFADVLADYRELRKLVPDGRSALQAYHALSSELSGSPEQARHYRELLQAGRTPTHALQLTRALAKLPAGRQSELHAQIRDDQSKRWPARTRMRLAVAQAMPSQAEAERAFQALEGYRSETSAQWVQWATRELTEPDERASEGVLRFVELSGKLAPLSQDLTGEYFLLQSLHAGMGTWSALYPDQSPAERLGAVIDKVSRQSLPKRCFSTLCHNAHKNVRAGETLEATLERLDQDWQTFRQSFPPETAALAMNAHLQLAKDPGAVLSPVQEWRARHGDEHLDALMGHLVGRDPLEKDEELLERLEKGLFLTGDLHQLEQTRRGLSRWAGDSAGALAPHFDAWVAASRLGAQPWDWDNIAVRAARAAGPAGVDLRQALPRFGISDQELASIEAAARPDESLEDTLTRVARCYGHCVLASKQHEGLVKDLIYELVAERFGDRMEAFPAIFKECAGLPEQQVRPKVYELLESLYDKETVEAMRQSLYLTGSFSGLRALREKLEALRPPAVPSEEFYQAALAQLHRLRLHGTPPGECVTKVLQGLETDPVGDTVGRLGDRLVVGGVPIRTQARPPRS